MQHLVMDVVRHPGQLPLLLRLLSGVLRPAATLPSPSLQTTPPPLPAPPSEPSPLPPSTAPAQASPTQCSAVAKDPLSTLLAVLREVLGVTDFQHHPPNQYEPQQKAGDRPPLWISSQQPPSPAHSPSRIRSPAEQRAFLSLLSGLLAGDAGARGQGGGAAGSAAGLVTGPQLLAQVAVPALERAQGGAEGQVGDLQSAASWRGFLGGLIARACGGQVVLSTACWSHRAEWPLLQPCLAAELFVCLRRQVHE